MSGMLYWKRTQQMNQNLAKQCKVFQSSRITLVAASQVQWKEMVRKTHGDSSQCCITMKSEEEKMEI